MAKYIKINQRMLKDATLNETQMEFGDFTDLTKPKSEEERPDRRDQITTLRLKMGNLGCLGFVLLCFTTKHALNSWAIGQVMVYSKFPKENKDGLVGWVVWYSFFLLLLFKALCF